MKFTKNQIQVILLLSAFIVLAAGGVFLLKFLPADVPAVTPPVEQHQRIRQARPSLNPLMKSELNVGGSGDETLNDVFTVANRLYIFGTTSSADYDFDADKGGVFLARLNAEGATEQFFQYGKTGDSLVKTLLCEGGFLMAVNQKEGGSFLLRIDFDGTVVSQIDCSGNYKETFADVKGYDNRYVGVMRVTNETTQNVNLKVRVFDAALSLLAEREFPRAYTVDYLDMFETADGNYVIAANMVSPLLNRLLFIKWGMNLQGAFYDIDVGGEGQYRCDGILPYQYGYAAVIVESTKVCDMITITDKFELQSRVYLKQSAVQRARLLYAPGGYYCYMQRGVDVSSMLVLNDALVYQKVLSEFSGVDVYSHYVYTSSALFCTASLRDIRLITATNGDVVSAAVFGGANKQNVRAVKMNGKFVVVCEASGVTSDCPSNFGGKDVWISFMNDF